MIKKLRKNTYELKSDKNNRFYNLFLDFAQLKNIFRLGWTKYFSVSEKVAESVADHSFSTSVLAYTLARETRPDLDADKILKMALFHEVGEIYVGDIPLSDKVSREKKHEDEHRALKKVLGDFVIAKEIEELWIEFEQRNTPESKFLYDIDRLEAVLQAKLYQELKEAGKKVEEFQIGGRNRIKGKESLDILESLKFDK